MERNQQENPQQNRNTLTRKRRGRPPKYPDVWGRPIHITQISKEGLQQPISPAEVSSSDVTIEKHTPSPLSHHSLSPSPEMVSSPHSTEHVPSPTMTTSSQPYAATADHKMDKHHIDLTKERKGPGRPKGSLNKRSALPDDTNKSSKELVISKADLLRKFYEAGGRDYQDFSRWVEESFRGLMLPVKVSRLDNSIDSPPTYMDQNNEFCVGRSYSPPPLTILPGLSTQEHETIKEQYHQPVSEYATSNHSDLTDNSPSENYYQYDNRQISNRDFDSNRNVTLYESENAIDLSLTMKDKVSYERTNMLDEQLMPVQECHSNYHQSYDDVQKWDVDRVVRFVSGVANCEPYAQIFKDHLINGELLQELTENQMVTYLNMKLGPSMHLRRAIDKLQDKQKQFKTCL